MGDCVSPSILCATQSTVSRNILIRDLNPLASTFIFKMENKPNLKHSIFSKNVANNNTEIRMTMPLLHDVTGSHIPENLSSSSTCCSGETLCEMNTISCLNPEANCFIPLHNGSTTTFCDTTIGEPGAELIYNSNMGEDDNCARIFLNKCV